MTITTLAILNLVLSLGAIAGLAGTVKLTLSLRDSDERLGHLVSPRSASAPQLAKRSEPATDTA